MTAAALLTLFSCAPAEHPLGQDASTLRGAAPELDLVLKERMQLGASDAA